jgi:hypothetical protein
MRAMRALRVKAPGKSLLIRSSLMTRVSPLYVCPNHLPHLEPDSLIVPLGAPCLEQRQATMGWC